MSVFARECEIEKVKAEEWSERMSGYVVGILSATPMRPDVFTSHPTNLSPFGDAVTGKLVQGGCRKDLALK